VFVAQAIARKIEPIEDFRIKDQPVQDVVRHVDDAGDEADIDDVGGDGAPSSGEQGGEAEEA